MSFFLAVLNSRTQNIQFPKNQTHYAYSLCSGRKDKGCKNLAHASKTRQVKRPRWLQLLGSRLDFCHFSRLQKIERNETVAPTDVRCKPPLCWAQWTIKGLSPGLHNKIIYDFIKICLPKFVILMHLMVSVDNLRWKIWTFTILILLNLDKDLSPEQFVTIKLRNKTPHGWIDRPRTTNLRHQIQTLLCPFAVCLPFVSLGRVVRLPFGKVTFAHQKF